MTLDVEVQDLRVSYGITVSGDGQDLPERHTPQEWKHRYDLGEFDALRGVSFRLEGGKIYGLLGRNGAGKTTLLSVLAGFRKPTTGRVRIGGAPVFENPQAMSQVCLVGTQDATLGRGTVKEALRVAARLRQDFDAGYADRLLERFQLGCDAEVDRLSRGGKAALRIVLGLASRAAVTMYDEPHLGLDVPTRQLFYDEVLADFMAHPRTIIVSTHLIGEIGGLFEQVVIIDRGQLVVHHDTEDLRAQGTAVTGPAAAVDGFVNGRIVLSATRLGPTKSVMVYGHLDASDRARARAAGLELSVAALEDLFVHLTDRRDRE